MRAINYRELRQMCERLGPAATAERLGEALGQKHLRPDDFSLRELAEAFFGRERTGALDPRSGASAVFESGEAVDAAAFSRITGRVIEAKLLEAYRNEAFVLSRLVESVPTRLDGERIPGVGRLPDEAAEVAPGMPYPSLGFGEEYIDTPQTTKRGFIVPVTKEAIFFDRTHLVLQRAAEVGEVLGLNKEKRLLSLLLGLENNYRANGAAYNTYYAAGDSGPDGGPAPWINDIDAELVDWTDVDAAEQAFADMTDPTTGEPVLIHATNVLVMPAYRHAAHRIFNAAEIAYQSGSTQTTAANPLGRYGVYESRLAYRLLLASGYQPQDARRMWFIGDFRKAFAYMENWPITVSVAPPNSEAEFNQDIVVRFKASERGAAAVINPRFVVRSRGTN